MESATTDPPEGSGETKEKNHAASQAATKTSASVALRQKGGATPTTEEPKASRRQKSQTVPVGEPMELGGVEEVQDTRKRRVHRSMPLWTPSAQAEAKNAEEDSFPRGPGINLREFGS